MNETRTQRNIFEDIRLGNEVKDLTYEEVRRASEELLVPFNHYLDDTDEYDYEELKIYAIAAAIIEQNLSLVLDSIPHSNMDRLCPDRGDIFANLRRIKYEAYDRVPIEELDVHEKEEYIKSMVQAHGEYYGKYESGYYYFGWPHYYFEIPEDRKLLEAITNDRKKVLTERERSIVYEGEKNTYKVHLNVPPERKLDVLKAILAAQEEDNKIVTEIFAEKKAAGVRQSATRQEVQEKGGKLATLNQYKMSEFELDNPYAADFVFYPVPNEDQTGEDALIGMVHELKGVLSDLDLPESERMPRFSTPVIINGKNIPGMTYVQGNGDFKVHLLINYEENMLDKYYDRDKNWAVRYGEEVNFDRDY